MRKALIWLVVILGVVLAVVFMVSRAWFIVGLGALVLVLGFAWFLSGFATVGPNEMAVRKFFGKLLPGNLKSENFPGEMEEEYSKSRVFGIYGFCDSGLHWAPRLPNSGLIRIPKFRFEIQYDARLMLSKENPGKQEKQELLIGASVFTEFKRQFLTLVKAVERGTPFTEEELKKKTDSLIDSALRDAAGSTDWKRATESSGRSLLLKKIKADINDPASIFSLGGLESSGEKLDIRVTVVDLNSKELKAALTVPDQERIRAKAAKSEAERITKEASAIGEIKDILISKKFNPDRADEIAHRLFELQVAQDLQRETGQEVVKIIRFQGGGQVGSLFAEAGAAWSQGTRIFPGSTTTGQPRRGGQRGGGFQQQRGGQRRGGRGPTSKTAEEARRGFRGAAERFFGTARGSSATENSEEEEE